MDPQRDGAADHRPRSDEAAQGPDAGALEDPVDESAAGAVPVRRREGVAAWPADGLPARVTGWRGWWRSPAAQVHHLGEHLLVHVELPGVRLGEVAIDIDTGARRLVVHGEPVTNDPHEVRPPPGRPGPFALWVGLPPELDADYATAELRDGVLTVRVPTLARPALGP